MEKETNKPIRLIAFDLDGTLLDSQKKLSEENRRALADAAAAGIVLVPTTGRLATAMTPAVGDLAFLRYVIAINGAEITDRAAGTCLARANIPVEQAVAAMRKFDAQPALYDCYMDGRGWMNAAHYARIDEIVQTEEQRTWFRTLRSPVPDLKAFLLAQGRPVQKMQLFYHTAQEKEAAFAQVQAELPGLTVTSSWPQNIEVNSREANKGAALGRLCAHLGIPLAQTMALGDGTNDITMLRAAGLGVAMANADPLTLAAADAVTASCDENGAARAIRRWALGEPEQG